MSLPLTESELKHQQAIRKFYDLVWPQRATVLRVARILTGNPAEAEDLAQETLLNAFRAVDRFQKGSNVKAWLTTIMRNARVDRLRAAGASSRDVSLHQIQLDPPDRSQPHEQWQSPQEILNAFSDQQIIDALQKLPEEIRWTLLLVDVQGIDHHDAAAALDVPVGTIKSRAHRGRAMLRETLLPLARQLRLVHTDRRAADPPSQTH